MWVLLVAMIRAQGCGPVVGTIGLRCQKSSTASVSRSMVQSRSTLPSDPKRLTHRARLSKVSPDAAEPVSCTSVIEQASSACRQVPCCDQVSPKRGMNSNAAAM